MNGSATRRGRRLWLWPVAAVLTAAGLALAPGALAEPTTAHSTAASGSPTTTAPTPAPSTPTQPTQPTPSGPTEPRPTPADPTPTRPTPTPTQPTPTQPTAGQAGQPTAAQPTGTQSIPSIDPSAAIQAKTAADRAVLRLEKQVSSQAAELTAANVTLETAQRRYNDAADRQQRAKASLVRATAHARTARAASARAERDLVSVAVSNYQNASDLGSLTDMSVTSLLMSRDPNALLSSASTQEQVDSYQARVLDAMRRADAAKRQAVGQRRAALRVINEQTARMRSLQAAAQRALAASQGALKSLREALVRAQAGRKQAAAVLSQFLGGWSFADPARAAALNATYRKLVQRAGPPVVHDPTAWSPAMGAAAAWRALQWLGTPYAWAGGNATGPTTGVCVAGDAANDCHIVGFDCSGLALFGWAPYLSMPHLAAAQYDAGRVHPALTALRPGDLVFWSTDGTAAGIHHVAIYIGNGNVVQAPNSGDIVRVTPLGSVDAGYFGATRPLT